MPDLIGSERLFVNKRPGDDCSITFFTLAQTLAAQAKTIVDVGCGRGATMDDPAGGPPMQNLRGEGRRVIGVDIDPVGEQNPMIDEFRLLTQDKPWPLDDASVDLIISDWTWEHVQDPAAFTAELARVLRPGGAFLARTVSRRSPLSIGARMVPNRKHAAVLAELQPDREECDVFPTAYRMNTKRALRPLLDPHFDWTVTTKPGLANYFGRWPKFASFVDINERRFPRSMQMVMIISGRKR